MRSRRSSTVDRRRLLQASAGLGFTGRARCTANVNTAPVTVPTTGERGPIDPIGAEVERRPRDGIVVQDVAGGDMRGYGLDDATPERADAERAVRTLSTLFAVFGETRSV